MIKMLPKHEGANTVIYIALHTLTLLPSSTSDTIMNPENVTHHFIKTFMSLHAASDCFLLDCFFTVTMMTFVAK